MDQSRFRLFVRRIAWDSRSATARGALSCCPMCSGNMPTPPARRAIRIAREQKQISRPGAMPRSASRANLTADLTVNPDFGQVEADPSEINLTHLRNVLQPKRPFFSRGKHLRLRIDKDVLLLLPPHRTRSVLIPPLPPAASSIPGRHADSGRRQGDRPKTPAGLRWALSKPSPTARWPTSPKTALKRQQT